MSSFKYFQIWRQYAIIAFLSSLIPNVSWAQRLIVYPCTDFGAIRWVRDSTFCDQYYICHFGQPLAMPSCPYGQVWSNNALNCVPQQSRWNDCKYKSTIKNTENTLSVDNNKLQTQDVKNILKVAPTESNIVIAIKQLPNMQGQTKIKSSSILANNSKKIGNVQDGMSFHKLEHSVNTNDDRDTRSNSWELGIKDLKHVAPRFNSTKENVIKLSQEKHHLHQSTHEGKISSSLHNFSAALHRLNIGLDHQCVRNLGALLPHPDNCHWYFNCSLGNLDVDKSGAWQLESSNDDVNSKDKEEFMILNPFRVREAGIFVWECRYPQLFDDVSGRCREFVNVDCQSRFEPVDQCEYSVRQCSGEECKPCDETFARCRGRPDGVYALHQTRWTPIFVTCYRERNIAQDECVPPTPIFSPEQMECVSLLDVPKEHGGFLPDCTTRQDGYYPDEQGRCAIFFRCSLGRFRGYDECPPGSVFDPATLSCQTYSYASMPCGEGQAPLCTDKADGLYADPYGRCTNYFECQQGTFQQYFTCDLGIFDPLTQRCVVSAELTVRPCGLQPSPCEELPTGLYPDQETGCKHFIECHNGNLITNGTCARGEMFSSVTGRCSLPEYAPPPCGVSPICTDQPDGRYPAVTRGCSFFYECYHGEFLGLRRCTDSDGGFFFNPGTQACDYPHNICPPCGTRWWGCSRPYTLL